MIDSNPYEGTWEKIGEVSTFWTFGPQNGDGRTGTYILTVLGIALMFLSLGAWVWLESRKLSAQAALLRAAGGLPAPGGFEPVATAAPSQPPFLGPSKDPGD
jgi:hypothetical protein